jgi:glycosyltransferase involved in cell wall biosynthesis
MSKISLIIPVYNTENFLAECLESCINQTFKDIEIICVNDCSPDNSYKILEDYAKKDSRIRVITHDKNKGLGGARNTGIEAATGEYCWFIDSDDRISHETCEILYGIIVKTPADIIRFNYISFWYDSISHADVFGDMDVCSWPFDIVFTKNVYTRLNGTALSPCTFVSRSVLLKTLRFRECVVHEDNDFTPILFSEAKSIFCVNIAVYLRRLHSDSTTGGSNILTPKRTVDSLLAIKALNDYIVSSHLPTSHFCVRTFIGIRNYVKDSYKKYPKIHTHELDTIIKNADAIKQHFTGDAKLYSGIINTYGNTRILEFVLRVYRFIVKRIFRQR